jgi:hypothetical protein
MKVRAVVLVQEMGKGSGRWITGITGSKVG